MGGGDIWRVALLFEGLLFPALAWPAEIIGVPFAGSSGSYAREPFALVELGVPSCRYQQVYSASAFQGALPEGGLITGIYVSSDDQFGHGFGAFLDIQIDMAVTPRGPDQLSTVFTENIGANLTTVFPRGELEVIAQGDGRGSPVYIGFASPFFYNPVVGNLLLDVRNIAIVPDPNIPMFRVGPLDAWNNAFGEVDTVSRVFAYDVNAVSGTADSLGLTTFFVVAPVPEPSTWAFFVLGISMMAAWRCRRNRINR